MKIPHLLHVFSNFVPTGPEIRTVHLIGAFGRSLRHSILSMDGRTSAAELLPKELDVRLLESPPKAGSFATARRLRRLLAEEEPDLVLTYNWGAFDMLLAARSAGFRRIIHHEEGFNEDEAESFKRRRILARRLVLPGVGRLIVPSERLQSVATGLWKVPPERIRRIPNGIRLDGFDRRDGHPELRARLGIPAEAFVVGSVGSFRAVKSFARLLEAVAAAGPDVHLLLVGDGEERAALEARAAAPDLAGRVHFAGYQRDPAPYYRALDLFALSSDSEQMPVCLLEAMASSLPAVATDVGDVRTMLPPEQAPFLVPLDGAATAPALGARIAGLARSGETRERLGSANRRRAEDSFAFAGMCDAYREVYASVLTAP
ncbi:MAG TPA: glycosyltransferase [Thermoanaerobaculia bacterium]|nr:glycosyltransferase [Thermoanaerobaculia bacterium]